MPSLNLKPSHKPVKVYYETLQQYERIGVSHEGAVRQAFSDLLKSCCSQFDWTLVTEWQIKRAKQKPLQVDGALIGTDTLPRGYWEAKDIKDNLDKEIKKKFQVGYPKDNILFQTPKRVIIWQGGKQILDEDITKSEALVDSLRQFFEYRTPLIARWEVAATEFGGRVKELGDKLIEIIAKEHQTNAKFIQAFTDFLILCRSSINPNLSEKAIEEMLIQHLLTERIFRKIFDNPDFIHRNVIAVEIEKVIKALTSKSFSRDKFLDSIDYFYVALEDAAATIDDFSQKQHFLNTVYEKFFQGFSIKVADTHGIVYTPQPIVNFMVKSVEDILQKEFGKSLSDKGVHILDPFVGTGNFIMRVMREIRKTALPYKFEHELHCNEVMLLPYYIASMNIEHEYLEQTGNYQPFEGICLVDTFSDEKVQQLSLFAPENTERVNRQRQSPIFVVIGNPPYNAWQVNENDNNKNRKYGEIDRRVKETYAKDSKATNKNALSDPYVKAIRWASDRLGEDGIVAFVSNNSFIDKIAFDGMRKHLNQDFTSVYILNLHGDIRKDSMRDGIPLGEQHTIFGLSAMVGIAVTFFVKNQSASKHKILYADVDFRATRKSKFEIIEKASTIDSINWQEIQPDKKYNWLNEGMQDDFETFLPMGSKETKISNIINTETLFKNYGRGVATSRDTWAYNFNQVSLEQNIKRTIETYNEQVFKWTHRLDKQTKIDDFVISDESKISWSEGLKNYLHRGIVSEYNQNFIRRSLYRPFTSSFLYFDAQLNERRYQFPSIFPTPTTEEENKVICLSGLGHDVFICLIANSIVDLKYSSATNGGNQCFPFYTYDEDGTNRRENITDWSLQQYRNHYQDDNITKWDIFHYTYAVLHHPVYRERYAANLKRELPRIPYTPDFYNFAKAGKRLSEIHVNYEQQPEYPLQFIENPDLPLNWQVEKMRFNKDKSAIIYNDFLTLNGIPKEAFQYRLGNRSALEWVIDQYQVTTDKRSGIVNDPNRLDDEEYIVRLIRQVITVSLETVQIVNNLPSLGIAD